MPRLWFALLVGALLVVGSGVVANLARAQSSGPDPASVVAAYEGARNRRDVDAALAYFADDAQVIQRNTTYSGKDEIRKFLEAIATRSRFVVVSDRHASGNHVMWTERSGVQGADQPQGPAVQQSQQVRPPGLTGNGVSATAGTGGTSSAGGTAGTVASFTVSVEAIVQDGKIRSVNYITGSAPARLDPSLEGRAQLPATVGLAAVGLVMATVLLAASLSFRRGLSAPSSLRGGLLQDLQGWSAPRQ